MSVFSSIFGGSTPAAQPAPAQASAPPGNMNTGSPGAPATPTADANGVVPPNTPAPAATPEKTSNSPLDQFKELWDPIKNEGSANGTPKPLDPAKLQETINKVDFAKVISPDVLSKITAGGEDATAAFATAMNSVAQTVMLQSTLASNKLIERAVAEAVAATEAKLPNLVKQQGLADGLKSANPIFSNPAVKPIIEATKTQLAAKFPDATVSELTEMTQNYILAMGEAFNPAKPTPTNSPNEIDWFDKMGLS